VTRSTAPCATIAFDACAKLEDLLKIAQRDRPSESVRVGGARPGCERLDGETMAFAG
jgi:hypothetical protein